MDRHARRFEPPALRDNSAAEFRNIPARIAATAAAAKRATRIAERRRVRATLRELAAVVGPQLIAAGPSAVPASHEQAAGRINRRGLFDQVGTRDDEPADVLAHPAAERREAKFLTVYAVTLIFQPCDGSTADPLVTLRQFVRQGRNPLTSKEAGTIAAAVEVENWKVTRPPLEVFGTPTAVVCWQAIPAFS